MRGFTISNEERPEPTAERTLSRQKPMKKHKPYSSTHYRQRSAQLFLLSVIASLVFFRPLVSHAEYGTFLQYIKVDFFECDDTTGSKKDKKIYLELNENSSVNLCYQVTNTYSEPLDVKVNFVDG